MDISKLSITELKAMAYDELAKVERAQANIQLINQQIAKLSTQEAEEGSVIEDQPNQEGGE